MKHQIEMLDVGDADCFIIQLFSDDNHSIIILVDAGNYGNGQQIIDHFSLYYPNQDIDIAIVTHPDIDHFGGFLYLLEQQENNQDSIKIKKFIVNDPGNHIKADDVKRRRSDLRTQEEARSVYDIENHGNLLSKIDQLNIKREEAFTNKIYSYNDSAIIHILGPSCDFFTQLVPFFRNNLEPNVEHVIESFSKTTLRNIDEENDDTSTHNASSLIFLFTPEGLCGKKYLFLGDASREAITSVLNSNKKLVRNCHWLKVPHHGSIHNLTSQIISIINPQFAVISAAGNEKHPAPEIIEELNNCDAMVFSTHYHSTVLFRRGTMPRKGWHHVNPL